MTAKAWDHRYWFEEVCFEWQTNGFYNNHFLIVKRLSVVNDLRTSVLIWRSLLLIWNQQYLQHPFSYGEASRCCQWKPKPMIIRTDLGKSASNLKLRASAATIFLLWYISMLSMTAKTDNILTDLKRSLRIWNRRFLQQPFPYGETSQCCPWQPTPWMICTELKRSASNLKPTVSAATNFLRWNVSVMHDIQSLW